jgi:aminoglycoside phosphotransferase (APT) family kinase protein
MPVEMPIKQHARDPVSLGPVLRELLRGHFPDRPDLEIEHITTPSGAGVNNETVLVNLTWSGASASGSSRGGAVLRLETDDNLFLFPPFRHHFELMQIMERNGEVPVPHGFGLCLDDAVLGRPFFLMNREDGTVPADTPPFHAAGWLKDAGPSAQHAMWSDLVVTMAKLHATPLDQVDFLQRPALGRTGFEQELAASFEYMDLALEGESNRVLEATRDWLVKHLPDDTPTQLAWGDARPQNIIFRDNRVAALLDWDMASLAGAEADLAWWAIMHYGSTVSHGIPCLPGWSDPEQTIAEYERVSGRRLRHMGYHFVFAAFRGAIIVGRLARMLDCKGICPPTWLDFKHNSNGVQYLASMLGLPPLSADSQPWPGPAIALEQ